MNEKIGPESSSLSSTVGMSAVHCLLYPPSTVDVGVAALFVPTNIFKLLIMMTFQSVSRDLDCALAAESATATSSATTVGTVSLYCGMQ